MIARSLLVAAMLLGLVGAAAAGENRTPFVAYGFGCAQLPGEVSVTGNTLHIRNLTNFGFIVSDNALVNGPITVWVSININLKENAGDFAGTLELRPTALGGEGTWVGSFGGHLKGGKYGASPLTLVDARIIAQGTGVLEGQKLMFDHFVNTAIAAPDPPPGCPVVVGEFWQGDIIQP